MRSVDQVGQDCLLGGDGGTWAAADLLLRAFALDPLLTETEEKILDLLRGGPTNAEIATHLGITTRTVKFHVSNLRVKHCGLSRLQLCLLATLRLLRHSVAAGTAVAPAEQQETTGPAVCDASGAEGHPPPSPVGARRRRTPPARRTTSPGGAGLLA
ncbi:helix-turn-helix transcriptional regulator [Streptomyces sp. NPDC005780]|uniref:helix-turn-helix domain-containing protein n=1 Tax=Streptomyces sp. NPDC005780 TaxID=3364730 RepID=UPI0036BC8008